jgi:hypothetical protein
MRILVVGKGPHKKTRKENERSCDTKKNEEGRDTGDGNI